MSDRSGQNMGVYRLIHLLGRGSFAEVYLGQHIHLHSQAAVKILRSTRLNNRAEIESFQREAQTIAALNHPNIVRVLDFNIEQGVPFFVMEYATRRSLRHIHPKGTRLRLPTILSYTLQIASALQYAHDHKQIHRDVKPENILVRDDGSIMLSDFGIATIVHGSSSQRTEDMIGTVTYMAPEQMQGHPRPASDQYALAIIVYEWITGQPPFQGTDREIVVQHITADPPSLITQVPSLLEGVEQIVLKALTKDPKLRYTTIQEFALALEQAIQGGHNAKTFPRTRATPHEENISPFIQSRQPSLRASRHAPALPHAQQPAPQGRSRNIHQLGAHLPKNPPAHSEPPKNIEQKISVIASINWGIALRKIRLGDTPFNWQVHYAKKGSSSDLNTIVTTACLFLGSILCVFGIAGGGVFVGWGVFFLLIGGICGFSGWTIPKKNILVLTPEGVVLGDKEKDVVTNTIDFAHVVDIRAKNKQIIVKLPGENAKNTQTHTIDLEHFEDGVELAKSIERAYLQFIDPV